MARKAGSQPTEFEMEVLQVLWELGPCSLGDIHEAIAKRKDVAYSTTRKMTQVMREKGLIKCREDERPMQYSAAKSQALTQKALVRDLAKRAFGGDPAQMMMSLLSAKSISDDELSEMKEIIESERKRRK